MKVISIMQPWATLIALGEKKFETRSWATKYRGELAIHASKKVDKEACRNSWFEFVLEKHGYTEENLPIGVILAKCRLADCHEVYIDSEENAALLSENGPVWMVGKDSQEFNFGWYESGRYAWELMDVKPLDTPIPAKGQLGIWNWEWQTNG